MIKLEDHLRPRSTFDDSLRDAMGLALLLALGAVLLLPGRHFSQGEFFYLFQGQLISCYLLPAMGFLLALRCGAVDLSVWAAAGVGGVTAATLIQRGMATSTAMAVGVAAGAAMGMINGLLTAAGRLPSVAVTLLVALAVTYAAPKYFPGRAISVPDAAFDGWHVIAAQTPAEAGAPADSGAEENHFKVYPLTYTRMLLVGGLYCALMALLLIADMASRVIRPGHGVALVAAMTASGALAAAGGVCWLLEYGRAPIPTQAIGDLRIPAAAVLAGGAFLTGRGRMLLAGICLPFALLVATTWRQEVWNFFLERYELQTALLLVMTVSVHAAFAGSFRHGQGFSRRRLLAAAAVLAGVLLFAASGACSTLLARRTFHVAGLGVYLFGLLGAILVRRSRL